MEFKGTKGKWILSKSHQFVEVENYVVCAIPVGSIEDDANAKLIASAPEMFDMLQKLLESRLKFEIDYVKIEKLISKITQ